MGGEQWPILAVFSFYRLCIAAILLFFYFFDFNFFQLGHYAPELYEIFITCYVFLALVFLLCVFKKYVGFTLQANTQVIADIVILTLLLYASYGAYTPQSLLFGFGILLNAVIAGGGLLTGGRISLFFAAIASIAVLLQHFFSGTTMFFATSGYQEIGILGATFFATATLGYGLSRRIKASEALARQRRLDVSKLEKMNELIIHRMHSGVIIVDEEDRVRFMNQAAWYLLGVPVREGPRMLYEISPELAQRFTQWRKQNNKTGKSNQVMLEKHGILGQITLVKDDADDIAMGLIFLEDAARMAQQAQQIKLASLGRLTASIAHEIRNPLGAISHAGQLLAESPHLKQDDLRLTEIIKQHSERMNQVIENVLKLSRRKEATPKLFKLKSWLEDFITQFKAQDFPEALIKLDVEPGELEVFIDPSQLRQVLTNLCENGIRYSGESSGKPQLELKGGVAPNTQEPVLEIIDFGPGIKQQDADYIFEPFFTTKSGGTGLGLYIAKELCEANGASLQYFPREQGGSCFRIIFGQPGHGE